MNRLCFVELQFLEKLGHVTPALHLTFLLTKKNLFLFEHALIITVSGYLYRLRRLSLHNIFADMNFC